MKKAYGILGMAASVVAMSAGVAGCAQAVSTGMESHYDASKSAEAVQGTAAKPLAAGQVVLPGSVPAESAPAEASTKVTVADGTKLVEQYFSGWQSMTANFSQTTDGEAFVQEGTFYAKRPQQFLWRYETPMKQKIVGTGSAIYYVDEETNTVTQLPANAGLTRLFTGGPLNLKKEGMNVTYVESNPLEVAVTLAFDPKIAKEAGGLKSVKMMFGRNPTELRRVEATDAAGVLTVLTLSDVKRDVAVDGALFKYTPPQQKGR